MYILSEALKDTDKKQDPHLFDSQKDRIRAYNALASYYLNASEHEESAELAEKMVATGMNNINGADNLNLTEPETWITKSFYLIALGDIKHSL